MEDGATWKTNFLILGIHTLLYSSDPLTSTDDDVFTIMCWSLLALYYGRYPPKNWDGSDWIEGSEDYNRRNQPLADGFCCVLWSIFGDLDHYYHKIKARRYSASEPCTWCSANTSTRLWSDFRPGLSAWMPTTYTAEQYRATMGAALHKLYDLPGVTILTLWPDYMHCKFMGSDAYFYGSVLTIATFIVVHPALDSFQARLDRVWSFCKEYWQTHPCDPSSRFRNMKIGFFTKASRWRNTFPKLKGRASEIKHLGLALAYAWEKIMDGSDPKHQSILLALQMSVKMDKLLDDHHEDIRLPDVVAADLCTAGFVFLDQFTCLANSYNTMGNMLFNLTVKCHMLAHICLRCNQMNPRRAWCFSGERMMLLMRRIVQSCTRGTGFVG